MVFDVAKALPIFLFFNQILDRIAFPVTTLHSVAQPCVNNGTNVLGPNNNGKQIQNQENQCSVTGKNVNQLPVAIATTPSQVISQGSPVTLDGTGSFAQNGATIVSYSWVQIAGPTVTLTGASQELVQHLRHRQ